MSKVAEPDRTSRPQWLGADTQTINRKKAPIRSRDGGNCNPLEPEYTVGRTVSGRRQTIGQVEGSQPVSQLKDFKVDRQKYMKNHDIQGSMNQMALETTLQYMHDQKAFLNSKHKSVRNKRHTNMEKGWYGANIFKNLDQGYSVGTENERPKAYSYLERNVGGQPFLNASLDVQKSRLLPQQEAVTDPVLVD